MKNGLQVGAYSCGWVGVSSETDQLWMVRVAASAAEKNGLGEESLSPKCHEPGWVEVFRVDGPEAQGWCDVTLRAIRGKEARWAMANVEVNRRAQRVRLNLVLGRTVLLEPKGWLDVC